MVKQNRKDNGKKTHPYSYILILTAVFVAVAAILYWFWAVPYRSALGYREQLHSLVRHHSVPAASSCARADRHHPVRHPDGGLLHAGDHIPVILHLRGWRLNLRLIPSVDKLRQKPCHRPLPTCGYIVILDVRFRCITHRRGHVAAFD